MGLVIPESLNLQITECLGRIITQLFHHGSYLFKTFLALLGDGILGLFVITVLLVHLYHHIPEGDTLLLAVACHFTEAHNSHNCVLIPCMGTCQAAVALFQAENIIVAAGLFEFLDLLAYILKAGKHVYFLHAVCLCDSVSHICGNDGGYQCRVLRHGAVSQALP